MYDFKLVGGSIPILPKYSLGVWWTRWFDYDDRLLKEVMNDFKRNTFPVDVVVLDMNWHSKNLWGGYSWDPNLLPYA